MTATLRLLILGSTMLASSGFAALPATAAVINVGPGGTTLPLALNAALAPGDDEIRIATGEHSVNATFNSASADMLTISGGWDPTFTTQTANPALSVLDGGASDRTLFVGGSAGRVEIHNLTVRNGRSFTGAGIEANLGGTVELLLADLVIRDNLATWEFASNGGGLKIHVGGDSSAEVRDCVIRDNRSVSTGSSTSGGGAYFGGASNGLLLAIGNVFENNVAQSPSNPQGGGFHIDAFGQSTFDFSRNVLRNNRLEGGATSGGAGAALAGVAVQMAALELRALRISDNTDASRLDGGQQVQLLADNEATVKLGDSEISRGSGGGALLQAYTTSSIKLVNLTVADHPDGGLVMNRTGTATTTLFSSILWGNDGVELTSNLAPNSVTRNRIEGTPDASNPLFVDAAGGNYRLRTGSPAIDQGDATPDGGIGMIDADGGERRIGENVDQGAYEFGAFHIFVDGFED